MQLVSVRGEGLCWKECYSPYQLHLDPDGQVATYRVGFQAQLWLMAGDKGEQETVKRRVTGGPDWSAVGLGSRKKEA